MTLPLSMPGVAAGVLLVFVLALGFYITPAMVGGPREITLSMLIAQRSTSSTGPMPQRSRRCCWRPRSAIIGAFYRLPGVGNAFRMSTR